MVIVIDNITTTLIENDFRPVDDLLLCLLILIGWDDCWSLNKEYQQEFPIYHFCIDVSEIERVFSIIT